MSLKICQILYLAGALVHFVEDMQFRIKKKINIVNYKPCSIFRPIQLSKWLSFLIEVFIDFSSGGQPGMISGGNVNSFRKELLIKVGITPPV